MTPPPCWRSKFLAFSTARSLLPSNSRLRARPGLMTSQSLEYFTGSILKMLVATIGSNSVSIDGSPWLDEAKPKRQRRSLLGRKRAFRLDLLDVLRRGGDARKLVDGHESLIVHAQDEWA